MTHRTQFLFAVCAMFAITLMMVPTASAQDEGGVCGVEDIQECFTACAAHSATLPEETDPEVIIAACVALPACQAVSMTVERLRSARSICTTLFRDRAPRVAAAAPLPVFCVLPDGTSRDTASTECQCPEGWYAIAPDRARSRASVRALRVPRGHALRVCFNPMALSGAPGSLGERSDALEATLASHDAALRALCEPAEDEDLVAACTRARSEFLALGSSEGPVDLDPIISRIEELTEAAEALEATVDHLVDEADIAHDRLDGHDATLMAQSQRLDALTECILNGEGHHITLTEVSTGVTSDYTCPELLASTTHEVLEQARAAAREIALQNNGGRAFILFQAFGLLAGPEVRYGNSVYGLPWAVGGELTLGLGLGGAWNIQGGLGLGAAFPDVTGVTNVMVEPHLGFGVMMPLGSDVHFGIGFGGLATLRFLPDGRLAHTIYAAYLEATFRFMAQSEWSPVLTLRGFGGVSPREVSPGNFEVGGAGGGEILIGFGHF
ncbi:hypothetical protein IT087_01005 [Candidatus Uhrbacteria bacterium]|nr:hypothetical protein [Candidatus Uhrbacteria bacterium]